MNNGLKELFQLLDENNVEELISFLIRIAYKKVPRIIEVFVELFYLLQVKIVDEDEKCPSAAIGEEGGVVYLYINRNFVKKYIQKEEELLALILHELLHNLRRDFENIPEEALYSDLFRYIYNVVADYFVDSTLLHEFSLDIRNFQKRLVEGGDALLLLLIPPQEEGDRRIPPFSEGLKKLAKKIDPSVDINQIILFPFKNEFESLYIDMWLVRGRYHRILPDELYKEIKHLVLDFMAKNKLECKKIFIPLFMRSHTPPKSLHDFFKRWGIIGKDEKIKKEVIQPVKIKAVAQKITDIIKKAMEEEIKREFKINVENPLLEREVIPNFGRREVFLLSQGVYPVFFPYNLYFHILEETKRNKILNLYIDVSGSFYTFLPLIFGIIIRLKNWIGEKIYQFSNIVIPVSLKELEKGSIATTFGTDLDCVIEHALKNNFKKILIITDGFVLIKEMENLTKFKKRCEAFTIIIDEFRREPQNHPIPLKVLKMLYGDEFQKEKNRHWWWITLHQLTSKF
jgi:hypothetical protein